MEENCTPMEGLVSEAFEPGVRYWIVDTPRTEPDRSTDSMLRLLTLRRVERSKSVTALAMLELEVLTTWLASRIRGVTMTLEEESETWEARIPLDSVDRTLVTSSTVAEVAFP
jgi:hypothetical protein